MDIANILIQTPQGEQITIQEAYNRSGFTGDFWIDVWGYWCGPCIRIKPFLKGLDVIYIHLGKVKSENNAIPSSTPIGKHDYLCVDGTAGELGVSGVPFVKKVSKDLIMGKERYYPGTGGMQIMK